MSSEHAEPIRRADQADANGDLAAMLEYIDPELEWSYLGARGTDRRPARLPRPAGGPLVRRNRDVNRRSVLFWSVSATMLLPPRSAPCWPGSRNRADACWR